MYGQGYVGTSQDVNRIRRQEKEREEAKKKFEELQQQSRDKVKASGLRQFGASKTEALEFAFKNETVGLQSREEFIQKRTTLQERLEEEEKRKSREAEEASQKERDKRAREKSRNHRSKLSFVDHEDEDVGGEEEQPPAAPADGNGEAKRPRLSKLGKDPSVPTDFLPDRERERHEEELREQLKKEWELEQERQRNEPLNITYSYWDGQGHRRVVTVRRGDSVGAFLKAVRDQLSGEFRELRAASVDNLMYIKEDVILQQHLNFHDLIQSRARGKSGPLFDFEVREDVRLSSDARVEKVDSHAGKVVERHWYDKNKHIFPASRWEVYDPDKAYDKYTIFGS